MFTVNSVKVIGVDQWLGSLRVGWQVDISVLELCDGVWEVYDVLGVGLCVNRVVVLFLMVKRGCVFMFDWGLRFWGWEFDCVLFVGVVSGCCC